MNPKKEQVEDARARAARKRFLAYLIDWYVGALCTALPMALIASRLLGDVTNQRLSEYPAPYGLVAGMLGLLFAAVYYVVVPLVVWPGQTFGKRMCGLKIVRANEGDLGVAHLVLRQAVGIAIVEGVVISASSVWHQMLSISTGVDFTGPLMYAGFVVALVSCAMVLVRKDHRSIHDFLGDSAVVSIESN